MRRFIVFNVLFCILILSGCKAKTGNIPITISESFECTVSINYGEFTVNADMVRTMPQIYSFVLKDNDFDGAVINLKPDCFSFDFSEMSYESDSISKASFLYGFTEVLDYLSGCDSSSLVFSELRQDTVLVKGNNGYEDFEMTYDIENKRPLKICVNSLNLKVTFGY